MGLIYVFAALTVPRVLMGIIFLVTDWFARGFETRFWPVIGFLFMPYATLAYLAAMLNHDHVLSGGWLALFIAAIIVDVAHWGGSGRTCWRKPRAEKA